MCCDMENTKEVVQQEPSSAVTGRLSVSHSGKHVM